MLLRSIFAIPLTFGMAALLGCGSGFSKVEGTVTFNNEPVEGATVLFLNDANPGAVMPSAQTDAAGYFSISTGTTPGAPSGSYKILVTKTETMEMTEEMKSDPTKAMSEMSKKSKPTTNPTATPKGGNPMMGKMMMNKGTSAPKIKHLIPEKFSRGETTTFNVKVPAGDRLTLAMTDADLPAKK